MPLPLDTNPLLGEGLLCPTRLELEEKETSAPIYGELEEVRLGGRPSSAPTAVQGHQERVPCPTSQQDSTSDAGLNDSSCFAQHHTITSAPSHWAGIETGD